MTKKLGVAGLQLKKDPHNIEANIVKFEEVTRNVKRKNPWVDLIFTGELYLQQYGVNDWKEFASQIPNELTERLSEVAKRNRVWLVPGSFLEREESKIFNTSIVFNPEGEIIAKYRKLFPWTPHEDTSFGTDFVVFDIPDLARVGLTICYDVWFPELFRTLAWMGADIILQPSATYTNDRSAELVLTRAQAIMNQCYVLNVNVIQTIGGGESLFVGPEGQILYQTGTHEEIILQTVDLDYVNWVRQYGLAAVSPVWKCLRDSPLQGKFPPYENLADGEIFKILGATKVPKSIREWEE